MSVFRCFRYHWDHPLNARRELRRFPEGQVYGHWQMIRDAIRNGLVQLAHGHREMWSELVALFRISWIVDERFDKDPVEFEPAYKTTVVTGERVGRGEAFSASLVAICESATP